MEGGEDDVGGGMSMYAMPLRYAAAEKDTGAKDKALQGVVARRLPRPVATTEHHALTEHEDAIPPSFA